MKHDFRGKMTLEAIDKEINFWQEMRDVWTRCDVLPDDDLNTAAFKLYFRLQNVEQVMKELDRLGLKKFSLSKDVTVLLQKEHIADKQLEQRVKALQGENLEYSKKIH